MTEQISHMVVERIDTLRSRPQWIFVTGALTGEAITIGDILSVRHAHGLVEATVRTIETHNLPGKTTIALDARLKTTVTPGTIIERAATP
ncbi:hypothetical protein [Nocardia alni]|uniref:hypothetical protein n=1 Tax=Nocardia alni TaxID=2815723 RepID=UPI001C236049|nr:hypothetical protein [Nocardia alni]